MHGVHFLPLLALLAVLLAAPASHGADLVQLTPDNWDEYAPRGKEVDCIYGDYVLRNDRIIAVIAKPIAGRNANMTVQGVRGAVIDLTLREAPNDQLSAFYPTAARYPLALSGANEEEPRAQRGERVAFTVGAEAAEGHPAVTVTYELADGAPALVVTTVYENSHDQPLEVDLVDALRADRSFAMDTTADRRLFWAYDEWWNQAYGVLAEDHTVRVTGGGRPSLQYEHDGAARVRLAPGEKHTLVRRLFPAENTLDVMAIAAELKGESTQPVSLTLKDDAGPVAGAFVTFQSDGKQHGRGRSDEEGRLTTRLPAGRYEVEIEAFGRPKQNVSLDASSAVEQTVELEMPGFVTANITDDARRPIPCKVAFYGVEGTPDPNWGPDTFVYGVQNLRYTPDGRFRAEINPGKYRIAVSYGPEYDAVFTEIEVARGQETNITARLKRVVDTRGWISSDFHSHSSPSGDNTSSQLGRVLNLLCEHIEFAPCTEHNRISTYDPHLKTLGAERLMATCTGMELTGQPLPVNHQNAFPLEHKPRTQDGGGPQTDADPVVQIERLALWDNGADKLVQGNHPNLVQILGDRNQDGHADEGFEKMIGFMDVIEVHPPQTIFTPQKELPQGRDRGNPIFHWMQMLNLGYRVPGVVNTDAHYNHHGSGWIRNYLESPTDDPAEIDTMEIVHAAEHGHVLMTTGPFMEVRLRAAEAGPHAAGIMGDDVVAPGGKAELHVRVQCPNWMDVNRVQVFVNGRPAEELNFTRRTHAGHFSDGVVKFDERIPLALEQDAHVIVAAIGEGLDLKAVYGEQFGNRPPVAVSNPIFVDVDGEGFKPNGDLLGLPLPLPKDFKPSHPHGHTHPHRH
jgi:hypothetical protein